jgi:hypothetical protein
LKDLAQRIIRNISPDTTGLSFNFSGAVGIIAIPLRESPIRHIKEIREQPVPIGGLLVPTGSLRLRLPPGAYIVTISRRSDNWRAHFIDERGDVRAEVEAEVREASRTKVPYVSLEKAACYRFDSTIVCV